jgi:hypothetical protein
VIGFIDTGLLLLTIVEVYQTVVAYTRENDTRRIVRLVIYTGVIAMVRKRSSSAPASTRRRPTRCWRRSPTPSSSGASSRSCTWRGATADNCSPAGNEPSSRADPTRVYRATSEERTCA